MASIGTATLHQMSDAQLTLAHPDEDVRGRKVLDKAGEDIGTVDDLMIDDRDKKVRFLRVASGGFLGMGETTFLIPIAAVTKITSDAVHIDHTREHVAGGPGYAPELIADPGYWDGIYGYYGYPSYW